MNTSAPDLTPSHRIVLTLALVASLCGALIVAAFEGTQQPIAANKRIVLERAVFKVLPGTVNVREYVATPGGIQAAAGTLPPGALKFYAAFDAAGQLKGIAAEGAAKGYADLVRVLYGYDPVCQCIVGLGVVAMRETPGIGDKILTDAAFLANFTALDARLGNELNQLAHAIRTVRHGSKQQPWEIDAIAGATITSKAVGRAIDDNAQKLLPLLLPHLAELKP